MPKQTENQLPEKSDIIKHKNNGEWRLCVDSCRKYLDHDRNDTSVQGILALALFEIGDYSCALAEYQDMHSTGAPEIPYHIVRTCIAKTCKDEQEKRAAWRRFSCPEDVRFGRALELALHGQVQDARAAFVDALARGFLSEAFSDDHKDVILNSFDLITSDSNTEISHDKIIIRPSIKKVIVSGMGWSGSGAIFDYLREFHNVIPVRGEFPDIEGSISLRMIRRYLGNYNKLRSGIMRFFFYILLGKGFWENNDHFKLSRFVRSRINNIGRDEYASRIFIWCVLASEIIKSQPQERLNNFVRLADFHVNSFCIDRRVGADQIVLLDNVVHIRSCDCIEFLPNTTIICSFRDPRSNFVALLREDASFKGNISTFLERNNNLLPALEEKLLRVQGTCEGDPSRAILRVQFESFVISSKCREAISKNLGLEAMERDLYKHFKPWQSFRNVVLHEEHEDQAEIEKIRCELRSYCYDVQVVPLTVG